MDWQRSAVLAGCLLICMSCLAAVTGQNGKSERPTGDDTTSRAAVLDPGLPRVDLWSSLRTVADPRGELSPAVVEAKVRAGESGALPIADFAYGNRFPYPYWAQFSIKNPSDRSLQRLLTYELPTQDYIQLWVKEADGTWQKMPQLEEQRPLNLGSGHLYPVWRINLQPRQEISYMLRIDGYNVMRFPLYAVRDEIFVQRTRAINLTLGFVLAIPLVIMMYVLTLISIAEDDSLPLFMAIAVCELIGASWISGLMHELLPWVDRWISGWIGWVAYVVMLALSCQHARIFMNTEQRDPVADRILRTGIFLWLFAVPLLALIWPQASRFMLLLGGPAHAFILTWLATRGFMRKRMSHMAVFVIVWGVYATSGIFYVLNRLADWSINFILVSSVVQGSIVAALLGCAVSMQIVRNRIELENEFKLEQDRSLLYASTHHDLWQPLQSLAMYAKTLQQTPAQQHPKLLKGMNSAVSSIDDFMAGWEQISKEHSLEPKIQTTDLDLILDPLIEEFRLACQGKHIMLRYQPTNLRIQTDVQFLHRIVRNLITNAMRYTDSGGRILVGCRRRGGRRWLEVIDTGIGMNAEQAAQCFEAFRRFGDLERIPQGMGIGLYSVKRLANALGVETRLRSVPGKGTAVGVLLCEAPVTAVETQSEQGAPPVRVMS